MITSQDEFNNIYRAKVVSSTDKENLCRVKIRIPCIHGTDNTDGLSDDDLPYAVPCFMDISFDSGSFIVPEVGSTVFVFFEGGKIDKPVYFGCSLSADDKEATELGHKDSFNFVNSEGKRIKRAYSIDTPLNLYKGSTIRKLILFKTRKGASIEFTDEDDKEHLSIYDRLGQVFTMFSPATPEDNREGISRRGLFSVLKNKAEVKKKAIYILKSLSSSFLRFVSEVSYSKNEFTTVYKDDKAGISVDIGKDNRMLIYYKKDTLIELKEDKVSIKTPKIDIDGDINVRGNIKASGEITAGSTIKGDVYGVWVHSNASFPEPLNLDVDIQPYTDEEDEQIIDE